MGRIKHERVQINPKDVNDFFDRRGRSVNRNHELTSILYQDSNPELAESRDRHEKQTILPLLALAPSDTVLDIGCGIGRWADAVISHVHMYHGIDFSGSLIEYACSRLGQTPNVTFQVLAAQDVSPERIAVNTRFSLIIISGLLIYLNDEVCEHHAQQDSPTTTNSLPGWNEHGIMIQGGCVKSGEFTSFPARQGREANG